MSIIEEHQEKPFFARKYSKLIVFLVLIFLCLIIAFSLGGKNQQEEIITPPVPKLELESLQDEVATIDEKTPSADVGKQSASNITPASEKSFWQQAWDVIWRCITWIWDNIAMIIRWVLLACKAVLYLVNLPAKILHSIIDWLDKTFLS